MNKLLSVEFMYGMNSYYALVRVKQSPDHKEYFITIMDGQLEEILGKEARFREVDGKLDLGPEPACPEKEKVLLAITSAVRERLTENPTDTPGSFN